MLFHIVILGMISCETTRIASAELQMDMPNVCADQEMSLLSARQPCVQALTRMAKVWKQGCTGHHWCLGHERRTGYYTAYRQVYSMELHTVYRCCPGWSQRGEERGCLHRVCGADTCFNGGRCAESGDQVCLCPEGFQGTRCQYDVNECTAENGGCEGSCCNVIGSFYCKCPEGSRLGPDSRACQDLNECEEMNGGCQQTCVNTPGSYHCECSQGFRLHSDSRTCLTVTSCSVENGGCEHRCVDLGSERFRCECRDSFLLQQDGKHCQGE
ncbi:multiple epidermal growth factor-like domains protein 6 [Hypomesus transpacificus]|uniref:multiple epidermal growth factor-like domains protein 6 n=1 Tax=Hypomesus transpacificus TaxID=137520 RepID=UPI001F087BE9|nr:multiple epidermal growth factor-like domains protein 6 [Hypomesus transpacificus]